MFDYQNEEEQEEMISPLVIQNSNSEDEEEEDEFEEDEEDDEEDQDGIFVSYACEDCDYRWEVTFEDEEQEALEETQFCPMCGSANTSQI